MNFTLSYNDFTAQFAPHPIPELLQQLFILEQQDPYNALAEGFYLRCIDKSGLQGYSINPDFADSLIEFAQATDTGCTYAYWLIANDLQQCPIVVFGDEGGIWVIAQNLRELLHLLTFDTEPMVQWDSAFFYRHEVKEQTRKHSTRHTVYLSWVWEQLQLEAITTNIAANNITEAAQKKHQPLFNDFLRLNGIEID